MREAAEQSGLRVGNVRFVGVTSDLFEESGKHYITLWMAADAPDGDPHIAAPYEMDAMGWFGLQSLPSPLFTSLDKHADTPGLSLTGRTAQSPRPIARTPAHSTPVQSWRLRADQQPPPAPRIRLVTLHSCRRTHESAQR